MVETVDRRLAPTPTAVPISACDGMTIPLMPRPTVSAQPFQKVPKNRRAMMVFWLYGVAQAQAAQY